MVSWAASRPAAPWPSDGPAGRGHVCFPAVVRPEAVVRVTGPRSSPFTSVRRPPRRRWWRGVKIALLVVLTVALLAVALVGVVWAEASLRLGATDVPALASDDAALGDAGPRAPADARTFLVALVEERDPTAPRPAPLAAPVALVQVAADRDEVAVLALPRTLPVTVDDDGALPLDDVHRDGGLDRLVRAVTDYTGVRVDHAVVASLDALPRMTEALGGTERCGDAGCRVLDAAAVRAEIAGGDETAQITAVAETLRGLAAQVQATTPLRHPLASRAVIGAVADEVATDVSLRGTALLDAARTLATPRPVSVAVLPALRNPDSGELLVPPEQAAVLFQHLQQGTPLDGAGEVERLDLLPEDVRIGVLNGTGTAGLAGRIESQLTGAGFPVAGTDNAVSFDHEETVVAFDADDADAELTAVLVAEQLDDATLQPTTSPLLIDGERVAVQVTIGADLDEEADA